MHPKYTEEKAKVEARVEVEKARVEAEVEVNTKPFLELSIYFYILLGMLHSSDIRLNADNETVEITSLHNIVDICLPHIPSITCEIYSPRLYKLDYSGCSLIEKHLIMWKLIEHNKIHPIFFYLLKSIVVCYLFGWLIGNYIDIKEGNDSTCITMHTINHYTMKDICLLCVYNDLSYVCVDDTTISIFFSV